MDTLEEEFVPEEEGEEGPSLIKRLREKLATAVDEKQRYMESWQRDRADFANYKREEAVLHSEREARNKASVVEAIIPTLDSFEMALKSPSFKEAPVEWQKGIVALHQGLLTALSSIGVQIATPLGEKFDPYKHEALREVPTDNKEQAHTIEGVERAGYSIGDTIIRPAQVSVYAEK